MSSSMAGSWSDYRQPTKDELTIFDAAMQGHLGVHYQPVAVATQIVNGLNYSFFCNATPVTAQPMHEAAIVDIWMDGSQEIKLTDIHKVTH